LRPASTSGTGRARRRGGVVPDEEAGGLGGRLDGRRQPDALQASLAQCVEALEREREVGPAAVADERVDLVDDHLLAAGEDRPAARRRSAASTAIRGW
jgi:hypothetical protein